MLCPPLQIQSFIWSLRVSFKACTATPATQVWLYKGEACARILRPEEVALLTEEQPCGQKEDGWHCIIWGLEHGIHLHQHCNMAPQGMEWLQFSHSRLPHHAPGPPLYTLDPSGQARP